MISGRKAILNSAAAQQADGLISGETARSRRFSVDVSRLRRNKTFTTLPPGPFVDAIKVLRARVLQKMGTQGWRTLGVVSPDETAGTTLVAVNLAVGIALEANRTALLVEGNLRQPALHSHFGLSSEFGIAEHLRDGMPLERVLRRPMGMERLVLLPATGPVDDSAELLASPATGRLVMELGQRYADRIVVFDLPALNTADAVAMLPWLDCLLLVVGAGVTAESALVEALAALEGRNILGTVLNDAETGRE